MAKGLLDGLIKDKGKGNGVAGVAFDPKPANFTVPLFTQQTDGAIFWKITNAKTPMPPYKGVISDKDIWQIVRYLRTFSNSSKITKSSKQ